LKYSAIRERIVPHDYYIDAKNIDELRDMSFVFLAMDGGATKKLIVKSLETFNLPFVDVGMGIYEASGSLGGAVRVTTSTPQQRAHVWDRDRIPFADADEDNDYDRNIQIADLNSLNAALAVIKWKKLFDFYCDLEREHSSVYTVDGDHLVNEDQA
jgi:hypothetical protein